MSGPGIELTRVDAWLFAKLTGDEDLGEAVGWPEERPWVFPDVADDSVGADDQYVVYSVQDPGADARAVGSIRVMARPLYLVKAVAKTNSYEALRPAADRIDALLDGARNEIAGDGRLIACIRERAFRLPEGDYRHLGGLYRVSVQIV